MIIYKDLLSDDEMFSDAFEFEENFLGAFYKLKPKMVAVDHSIDNNAFAFNPSAEDEEDNDNTDTTDVVKNWDVVNASKLSQLPGYSSATDFREAYFRKYCKAVYNKPEGRENDAQEWIKAANAGFKFMKKDFGGYEMFAGDSWSNCDGIVSMGYLNWENNGQDPYMLFFKHAIVKVKV